MYENLKPEDGVAVDFETYYDKDYSLTTMSTWNYVMHERFDAYLVAISGQGIKFVGHPRDFDWMSIAGKILVMHNAGFDELVIKRLMEKEVIPKEFHYPRCFDTADLSVWMGAPRTLSGAAQELLGIKMDKTVRAAMKGKTKEDADAAGMGGDLLKYGGTDADNTYALFVKHAKDWPAKEQWLSEINRIRGLHGVGLDRAMIRRAVEYLAKLKFDAERLIPWVKEDKPPLSLPALREHCRQVGITDVPASLAKSSEDAVVWAAKYGKDHDWIQAVSDYRRINMHLERVRALEANCRDDDTMPYQLKYFGAGVTGRYSGGGEGGGKFNMQNMPRGELFGVDIRPMFKPRRKMVYVIADYAQIEARMLLWKVGDEEFIKIINEVGNIYLAYARKAWGRDIKKKTADYQLAKAQCLGLGYQCGALRYKDLAKVQYGIDMTLGDAKTQVEAYRAANPKIVNHWHAHQMWLRMSAQHRDKVHEVELPSGRILSYFNPTVSGSDVAAQFMRGGPMRKIHSGILTNNEIQGMARDVLVDALKNLDDNGFPYEWTVHDEAIFERPEATAESDIKTIMEVMGNSSPWAKGCPLEVEASIEETYTKG